MTPTPTDLTPEAVQALADRLQVHRRNSVDASFVRVMHLDYEACDQAAHALHALAARLAQEALSTADSAICGRCGHTCFHHAMLGLQECQVPTGCDCFEFVSDKSAAQLVQQAPRPDQSVRDEALTPERPGVWVILDCGHWYKWSGDRLPTREKDFPCHECAPPIEIVPLPDAAPATEGTR